MAALGQGPATELLAPVRLLRPFGNGTAFALPSLDGAVPRILRLIFHIGQMDTLGRTSIRPSFTIKTDAILGEAPRRFAYRDARVHFGRLPKAILRPCEEGLIIPPA